MSKNINNHAIGVFDSGLGGLTVVKELMRRLPDEDIVYFGDTARVPYGTKSKESIIRFSKENTALLLRYKVKVIVVACNTSSSVALSTLRRNFSVPIIDVISPGARKAAYITKNQKVGVIATQATVNSRAYTKMIKTHKRSVKVTAKACPLFVPLAEEGWFGNAISLQIARHYLKAIKTARCDTLILGCTHYPLLKPIIKKAIGCNVALVDSAKEVAQQVKTLLSKRSLRKPKRKRAQYTFLVSDGPKHFQVLAKRFLGHAIKNVKRASYV